MSKSKQERLSNDQFLERLSTLLTSTNEASHGSVFLSQKPLPSESSSTDASPAQILIRATNGTNPTSKAKIAKAHKPDKKIKLATVVEVGDVEAFYTRYAEVCRAGMGGMRKRDKKKGREKAKAKKKGKVAPA